MPPKAKPDDSAYQKLKQDIREGTIGTLYVFHGEETYLRDHYLRQMKEKLLPPGMEEFNYHTISGRDFDLKTLAQMVDYLPMMSQRTLILVTDWDMLKGDREALLALLSDLPEYVCLVFLYDLIAYRPEKGNKVHDFLKKRGCLVAFNRQSQGDLVSWIARHFKRLDRDISSEDALSKFPAAMASVMRNTTASSWGVATASMSWRVTRWFLA